MATAPPVAIVAGSGPRVARSRGSLRWIVVGAAWAGLANSAAAEPITFARHIAPIVYSICGECHRPGGPAPFSLTSYDGARRHARQMLAAVISGAMPPWKSESGYGDYVGQPRLTSKDVRLIERWIDDGLLEGDQHDLPRQLAWTDSWRLGKPDLVVTLPEPYELAAAGADVFRVFVIRLPVGETRFVRGLEFHPGNSSVHHANIRVDRSAASRDLDLDDPAPGYDGLLARSALYPPGHFLGWTPGQVAPLLPDGLSWRLDSGTDLVVQVHMRPSGKKERIQPSVGFFFGSDPPTRPVAVLRLGRQNIDIPAGIASYTVTDSYVLPIDAEVQAVQPHAHYRAREVKGFATLPDGTTKSLIEISDWDFNWQHVYRYRSPFWLPAGTTLSMSYSYDNSEGNPRNPAQPPVRALWGQRSSEEMGDLWIQVVAHDAADLNLLNQNFRPKAVAEDLIGYEGLIRRDPAAASLHDDAALSYLELGSYREAIDHLEASARLKPSSAIARFNLGTVLALAGNTQEAIAEFTRALEIDPRYVNAHNSLGTSLASLDRLREAADEYRKAITADPEFAPGYYNLGSTLLQMGQTREAIGELQHAVRLDPGYAKAHHNLGTALLSTGRSGEALHHYREAVRIDPNHAQAHHSLGSLLRARGETVDAIAELRRAVDLAPDWVPGLIDLAWVLATASDDRLRNAGEAVRLAERARAAAGGGDASVLDVLGVAYAAAGRFEDAIPAAQAALALNPPEPFAAEIRARLVLYRHSQGAFHE
jgi:tetratricopeptide (TPR) repeat protein